MNTPQQSPALALAVRLIRNNRLTLPAASVAMDLTDRGDLLVSLFTPTDEVFATGTIAGERLPDLIAALMGMAERLALLLDEPRGTA